MPRIARPSRSVLLAKPRMDCSRGLVTGISEAGIDVRHYRRVDNAIWKPLRALSVRNGYRDVNGALLPAMGHSLMRYYSAAGNKTFVGNGTSIHQIGVSSYTLQTLAGITLAGRWLHETNINKILVVTEEGGGQVPFFYDGTTWLTSALPAPPAAPTFNADTNTGGVVDAGAPGHKYRLRWRFKNGVSIAGPETALHVTTAPNLTVNLVIPAGSARADYLGWTLERTKLTSQTLWYDVVDGTAASYADVASDASLTTQIPAEPGPFGAAPHPEGVLSYRGRLVGWSGTNLYISQPVGGDDATGILNFHPQQRYPVGEDDGDSIVTCLIQPGIERIVILKSGSVWTLEGFDPASFTIVKRYAGAGCVSTRGATTAGNLVLFYHGDGKLFAMSGNAVYQAGDVEVGEYLGEADTEREDEAIFVSESEFSMLAYAASPDTYNRDVLAWTPNTRLWTHWRDMRISAALVPSRRDDFGRARLLFCDPKPFSVAPPGPVFISWTDARAATQQVYAQEVSLAGAVDWAANGVQASAAIANAAGGALHESAIIGDGVGGCIVAYRDVRSGTRADIYAQRFNAAGVPQWAAGGVAIGTDAAGVTTTGGPVICSDGARGVIIAWVDARSSGRFFVQRVNASGVVQWTVNGVQLCAVNNSDRIGRLLADGSGGCFATWFNYINPGGVIRMQRLNAAGAIQWAANGISLMSNSGIGDTADLCTDGAGGVLAAWHTLSNYYCSRINSSGVAVFGPVNVNPTQSAADTRGGLCPDGFNGAFVVWPLSSGGMFAQRVTNVGALAWTTPTQIDVSGVTSEPMIVPASANQCVIAWASIGGTSTLDVLAQRLNLNGSKLWGKFPLVVSAGAAVQRRPIMVGDGADGVVIAWQDNVVGNDDIIARRYNSAATISWTTTIANPTGNQTFPRICFSETPSGAAPIGTLGYKVWSGLDGYGDERAVDGTGGVATRLVIETPEIDDGLPDVQKIYDRISIFPRSGQGALTLTMFLDTGTIATLGIATTLRSTKWGKDGVPRKADTLRWAPRPLGSALAPEVFRWSGQRVPEVVAPLEAGAQGSKYRLRIAADLSARFSIAGFNVDFRTLPERGY